MKVKIIDKGVTSVLENIKSVRVIGFILVLEEFDGRQITYLISNDFKFSILGGYYESKRN